MKRTDKPGTGRTAQQLTTGVTMAEDLSWAPSNHIEQLTLLVAPAMMTLASTGTPPPHTYISTDNRHN